jgi:hypothetical protein
MKDNFYNCIFDTLYSVGSCVGQASVPYDVLEKERIREKIRHDLAMRDKEGPFLVGGHTQIIDNKSEPLCYNDPFMDSWANPLLMRGVPKNQPHLLGRAHTRSTCPVFEKVPEKPFYLSTSGNKNSVLPNNLFDTIADAEEGGGVVNRHRATGTVRFGLPQSCDNRVPGGELPTPPVKSATLMPTKRFVCIACLSYVFSFI